MMPLDIAFTLKMKFGSVIGQGAYGMVYKCHVDGVNEDLAFKRNMADKTSTGVFSVKELDILSVINGHPHIAKMEYVISGDISPYNPPNMNIDGIRDDLVHFIFERYTGDIAKTIYTSMNISTLKLMACQVLLALEYLHLNGIMHRDIKPSNILWSRKTGNFAICDFGMATYWTKQVPLSSSVVTSWYRAPEIVLGNMYLPNIDVWSLGMIMAGIVKGTPLLASCDMPKEIISRMLLIMPAIKDYLQSIDRIDLMSSVTVEQSNGSVKDQLKSYLGREDFFGTQGEGFFDLLSKMLDPNSKGRLSSTEALNHRFFDEYRKEIESSRAKTPKIPTSEIPFLARNPHKDAVMKSIVEEYPSFYSNVRPFFHAVEIYNRYDHWRNGNRFPALDPKVEACAVIYLMFKYFAPIGFPYGISKVFQNYKSLLENNSDALMKMEMVLCNRSSVGYIYQETPLEVLDRIDGEITNDMDLLKYYALNSEEGMTPRQVVSGFMEMKGMELPLNRAEIVIIDK